MKEPVAFFLGFMLGFIITAIIFSYDNNTVIKSESEWKTNACLKNGGIKWTNITYHAKCNDGASFSDDFDVKVEK